MQKEATITSHAATGLSEYDAITKTVQNYLNAGKTGRFGVPLSSWERG